MQNIIGIIALIGGIWVIYDVWSNNTKLNSTQKLVWTIAAIFFSLITAIIYYFTQKK